VKKSTLILIAGCIAAAAGVQAEETAYKEQPMVLASASGPLTRLPGMSAVPAASLPRPLVSDLTNFPNPFDSRKQGGTQIYYVLAKDADVSVTIYSLLGNKVRGWEFKPGANGGRQGANNVTWDGTNESNRKVAKGGYLAEIAIDSPEGSATVIRKIGVIH
jgi:hypothetical protein